jgi:Arc/MetJ family transcription regulator
VTVLVGSNPTPSANSLRFNNMSTHLSADICGLRPYILLSVAKHLIDVDEPALSAARAELGTVTIKDTVNEALRRAAHGRRERLARALDVLAKAELDERDDAWR